MIEYLTLDYLVPRLIDFGMPLIFALVGWWLIWMGRKTYRAQKGRVCPYCRYDMRASPGMACPECGRACRSQRLIEHGYVRWWLVLPGYVMIVPCAWMALFVIVSLADVMTEDKIDGRKEEYAAGIAARGEELAATRPATNQPDMFVMISMSHAQFPDEPSVNPVSRWAMRLLRRMMGDDVLRLSESPGWPKETIAEADKCLKEYEYRDASTREFWAGWTPGSGAGGYSDTLVTKQTFMTVRFMVQFWVNPIEHFRRYFEEPFSVPYPPGVDVVIKGESRTLAYKGLDALMPSGVIERLLRRGDVCNVRVEDVVCNDRFIEVVTRKKKLIRIEAFPVEASAKAMTELFETCADLGSVDLDLKRPLTEQELGALLSREKLQASISWTGQAVWSDEIIERFVKTPKENRPKLYGVVCPTGWKKTVEAAKEAREEPLEGTIFPLELRYKRTGAAGEISKAELRAIGVWGFAVSVDPETEGDSIWMENGENLEQKLYAEFEERRKSRAK